MVYSSMAMVWSGTAMVYHGNMFYSVIHLFTPRLTLYLCTSEYVTGFSFGLTNLVN